MRECGIDEAGRGCVAGSLFLAGVILDSKYFESFRTLGIKDSKQLTRPKREGIKKAILEFLAQHNGAYKIVSFDSESIDTHGLSACMTMGLQEIVAYARGFDCGAITFDGNTSFGVQGMKTLVRGDRHHALISAASILAKNSKDCEMIALHARYPHYELQRNAGYATRQHIESIARYGYTPIHRKSYRLKALEGTLFRD